MSIEKWRTMICPECNLERQEKDFLMNQKECYKCSYNKKVEESKRLRNTKYCQLCGKVITDKLRKAFCSVSCGNIGHRKLRNERWLRTYQGAPGMF
jgi:hypothetical protein